MSKFNIQINTLPSNLQQIHDARAALGSDERGNLISLSFKKEAARALVDLDIASEGKWSSRVVAALTGERNFEQLSQSSEAHIENSMSNVVATIKELETQGLDSDLSTAVEQKINGRTLAQDERLTKADFEQMHTLIQEQVIPQRRAYRAQLTERLVSEGTTPTMEGATYRGVAIAVAALEKNMEAQAMPYHQPPLKTRRHGDSEIRIAAKSKGPTRPITVKFAEQICGKNYQSQINRDVWDANKILGELKAAELHVREQVADLKGATQEERDHFIETKVAALKENLSATLKACYADKQAVSKAPGSDAETIAPLSGQKKGVRIGGVAAKEIESLHLNANFPVDDTNREQWVREVESVLEESEDSHVPMQIAQMLAKRGELGKDDTKTMKAIGELRNHPVFLKLENFDALYANIDAAVEEDNSIADGLPDEVKQIYRKNVGIYKELAQQKLISTEKLLQHLDDYKAGLRKLDSDPLTRTAQLKELEQRLGPYKDHFTAYQEVFDSPDESLAVRDAPTGGNKLTAIREARAIAASTKGDIGRVLKWLGRESLFVEKK